MKKISFICSVLLCASLFMSCMNNIGDASRTVKKLGEDLYFIQLEGDDGFESFLAKGGASSSSDVEAHLKEFLGKGPFKRTAMLENPSEFACSAFIAQDENGGFLVGRNYDWKKCTTIICKNQPDVGFASICTTNIEFVYGEGFVPNDGIKNKIKSLAGLYVPMDGINEKGLVVADLMAGDKENTQQDTEKPDLTTTTAIRLLLNKADTVEKAEELLNKYDMHSDIGTAHHIFVADASGKAVVFEWADGKMYVTPTEVLTNHYLCDVKAGIGSDGSTERMAKIEEMLAAKNKKITADYAKTILETVKAGDGVNMESDATQWSIVYSVNDSNPGEKIYFRSKFGKDYKYSVK